MSERRNNGVVQSNLFNSRLSPNNRLTWNRRCNDVLTKLDGAKLNVILNNVRFYRVMTQWLFNHGTPPYWMIKALLLTSTRSNKFCEFHNWTIRLACLFLLKTLRTVFTLEHAQYIWERFALLVCVLKLYRILEIKSITCYNVRMTVS